MQRSGAITILPLIATVGLLACSEPVSTDQLQAALTEYLKATQAAAIVGRVVIDPKPYAALPTPDLQRSCSSPSALVYVRYEQSQGTSSYNCVNERCTFNAAVAPKAPRCVHGWACVTRHSSGVKIGHLSVQAWTGEIPIRPGQWSVKVVYGPQNSLLKEGSILGLWRGVDPDVTLHSTTKYYPESQPIRIALVAAGSSQAAVDGTDFGEKISYSSRTSPKSNDLRGLIKSTDVYLDISLNIEDAAVDRSVDLLHSVKVRVPRLNPIAPRRSDEPYPVPELGRTYYVDTHHMNDQIRIRVYPRDMQLAVKDGERLVVYTEDMASCRKAAL